MSTKRKPTANHSIRTYGAENRKAAREKKQREKKDKSYYGFDFGSGGYYIYYFSGVFWQKCI